MNLSQLSRFCQRMGIGLKAGVDLVRLLENEAKSGSHQHREVMQRVDHRIRTGESLAKAMLEEQGYFPPLLVQMVHASEMSGRMDATFAYMADYYDQLKQTRAAFLQQIAWPIFQLCVAIFVIGLVILLQGILSPNSTYDASGVGLRGTSGFLFYCLVVGSMATVVTILTWGIWKNWFNCHRILVPAVQKIPALGTAFTNLGLSRLSVTLSMLLNAGVDARRSLKHAFLSTGNYYYISGMDRALAAVKRGSSFGDAFQASEVLPAEFVESVRIGELSGTETESLEQLAEHYQQRGKSALRIIAAIASGTIWLGVIILLSIFIIRLGLQYIGILTNPLQDF